MLDTAEPGTDHPADAQALTLATRPVSVPAQAFIAALLSAVEGHERRRKARVEGTRDALRLAVIGPCAGSTTLPQ
jgi:hypothetical protein